MLIGLLTRPVMFPEAMMLPEPNAAVDSAPVYFDREFPLLVEGTTSDVRASSCFLLCADDTVPHP